MRISVLIGFILGLIFAYFFPVHVSSAYTKYVAIGILAALDSLVGGYSAYIRKRFKLKIFISGFMVNSTLAVGLTFIGTKLGVDISLAAIVCFGTRLFRNLAIIRRLFLHRLTNDDQ